LYVTWIVLGVETSPEADLHHVARERRADAGSHIAEVFAVHDLVLEARKKLILVNAHI
jgi:hypothetical protein